MAMKSCAGKDYDFIWKAFQEEHIKHLPITDLERIHIKWKRIAAEVK